MTEPEKETIAALWEEADAIMENIQDMKRQMDYLHECILEAHQDRANLLREIKYIQGEIDWG